MDDAGIDKLKLAAMRRLRRMAMAIVLVIALFGALLAKVCFDWPAFSAPVPQLIQVGPAAAGRTDLIGRAYVYDCWGNFIDSQHLWRVEVKPEVIPAIVRGCELVELPVENVPASFWGLGPYWWRPPQSVSARYFASPGFRGNSRGNDGVYYLMAYDEVDGVLYAWVKNNF